MADKTIPTPTVKADSPAGPAQPTVTQPLITLSEFCGNALGNGSTPLLVKLFSDYAERQGLNNDTLDSFTLRFNQFSTQPVRI